MFSDAEITFIVDVKGQSYSIKLLQQLENKVYTQIGKYDLITFIFD